MTKLSIDSLRDSGRVRLGAGMRAPGAVPPLPGAATARGAACPPRRAAGMIGLVVPAAVADAGRVRFGAGMRRG